MESIEELKAVITERNITIKQQQEHNDALQLEKRKVTGQKMKWRKLAMDMYKWLNEQLSPAYAEDFEKSGIEGLDALKEANDRARESKV